LLAVTIGGLNFLTLLRTSHPQREAMWIGGTSRIDFADVWFNPNYSQIEGNWILLRYLLHIPPTPGDPAETGKVGTRLSDAIPPQDWLEAAQWDFVWSRRRSARPSDLSHPTPPSSSGPVQ
jgi:hypothetical protein